MKRYFVFVVYTNEIILDIKFTISLYWHLIQLLYLFSNVYGRLLDILWGRAWIWPIMKLMCNELDITLYVRASRLLHQLWPHYQHCTIDWDVITRTQTDQVRHDIVVWKASFWSSFMESSYVSSKLMYILSWQTVYALTRRLFWCLFSSLVRNSETKSKIAISWAHKQFARQVHASSIQSKIFPNIGRIVNTSDIVTAYDTGSLFDNIPHHGVVSNVLKL